MEQYIVSARKYRPSTFANVVGQRTLSSTLKNAIATDRLAHAYLFCGSRGVGKTSCARIFAKTINCTNRTADGEACNQCESCESFNKGTSLNVVELDAASHNGIEDIKTITDQVQVPPTAGKYRVFIIDEVHMLSTQAFNAFLKTLEEPPSYVVFILATTEKHKVIPTILSRCQIYDFNRITIGDMVEHLSYVAQSEGYTTERAALAVIARKADGAMRDALSIFDQVAASTRGNITYEATIDNLNILDSGTYNRLLDAFHDKNLPESLLIYKEVRDRGFDSLFFVGGMAQYLRDLMLAQNPATLPLLETTDELRNEMAARAAKVTPEWLYNAIDVLNYVDLNYRASGNKQLLVELALIKLCQLLGPSPKAFGEGLEPIAEASAASVAPKPAAKATAAPAAATGGVAAAGATGTAAATTAANSYQRQAMRGAPAGMRVGGLPGGLSLKHSQAATATAGSQATESQAGSASKRDTPFTPERIGELWQQYISRHGKEHFLTAGMRKSTPEPKSAGATTYIVNIEEGALASALNGAQADLVQWLRDELQNDHFELEINVVVSPDSPTVWTDRQVLDHMMESSEELRRIISELKLTLD